MAPLIDAIRETACLIAGSRRDYDPLLELAEGTRFVLLGEATHGSHELYRERARITQRLVAEQGFNAVVVEADWPDAERANRWAHGQSDDADATHALSGFRRFPAWMWRNAVVVSFLEWLKEHNQRGHSAMFAGMDLYSLYCSMDAVVRYLRRVDPQAGERARERYGCFELHSEPSAYGRAARWARSCEDEALQQLVELQKRAAGSLDAELFSAEQNARLARNAEAYYRAMFGSRISTWNLRDRHMAETLESIAAYLKRRDGYARVVVWAHNSHLGDARATEAAEAGELNVGQLLRERYGKEALLVGFTTYTGTVTAAHDWGDSPQQMKVPPALPGSIEALLHELGLPRLFLPLREIAGDCHEPLLERAIGVVYRPRTERQSHYFETRIAAQFDALIHVDHTRAVEPIDHMQRWTAEPPETYPSAL